MWCYALAQTLKRMLCITYHNINNITVFITTIIRVKKNCQLFYEFAVFTRAQPFASHVK